MMDRRNFLKTSGTLVGSMVAASALGQTVSGMAAQGGARKKIRYAMVGCGHRGTGMWGRQLVETGYKDYIDFVGLCDTNPGRLERAKRVLEIPDCPTFKAEDFDRMIKETRPDVVMVTTPDAT
ncbi:MAG: Gfo/Idh/MocA family oxidoreductase, partial [Prevotellaceae bacterium]|nr:Gfo/Idh/MocA family oxidoreductase [Prevotellaceae bacterium]